MADILKLDLYNILDVAPDASDKEIIKAYRKKALKCHPDKNPDNPKAADEFHQLSKALEILSDETARKAYDKALKAKKASELRHRELDSKRKKFKEDLEAREKSAAEAAKKPDHVVAAKNLEAEIERLRKEGSKLLEQEKARLEEELSKPEASQTYTDDTDEQPTPRLKVKWKSKKDDADNGGYSKEFLEKIFNKYGDVTALIVSGKKKGSAIVEFASCHCAMEAVQNEIGMTSNPLKLSWISGKPNSPSPVPPGVSTNPPGGSGVHFFTSTNSQTQGFPVESSEDRDYESLVMMRMRQAQERKRLIEQIQQEDNEDGAT